MIIPPDIHDEKPRYELNIRKVGLRGIPLFPLRDKDYWLVPRVDVYVDLPRNKKGIHTSRLYRIVYSKMTELSILNHSILEQVAFEIFNNIEYVNLVDIVLKGRLITEDPGVEIKGNKHVSLRLISSRIKPLKYYSKVSLLVSSTCPCALEVSKYMYSAPYTHNSIIRLTSILESSNPTLSPLVLIRELSSILSEPRNYMNRIKEAEFIKKLVENPYFLEDIVRLVAYYIALNHKKELKDEDRIIVKGYSIEPLHEYNLLAYLDQKVKDISLSLSYDN